VEWLNGAGKEAKRTTSNTVVLPEAGAVIVPHSALGDRAVQGNALGEDVGDNILDEQWV
jgi:hypothetical protein